MEGIIKTVIEWLAPPCPLIKTWKYESKSVETLWSQISPANSMICFMLSYSDVLLRRLWTANNLTMILQYFTVLLSKLTFKWSIL